MRGSRREGLAPVAPSEQNHGRPAIFHRPGASGRRPPHLGRGAFPSFYPLAKISGILFFNPSTLTSRAGRALGGHTVCDSRPHPAECPACALHSLARPGVPSGVRGPRGKPRVRPARSRPLHFIFQQC